jgi:hypothetical protein
MGFFKIAVEKKFHSPPTISRSSGISGACGKWGAEKTQRKSRSF